MICPRSFFNPAILTTPHSYIKCLNLLTDEKQKANISTWWLSGLYLIFLIWLLSSLAWRSFHLSVLVVVSPDSVCNVEFSPFLILNWMICLIWSVISFNSSSSSSSSSSFSEFRRLFCNGNSFSSDCHSLGEIRNRVHSSFEGKYSWNFF